MDPSGKQLAVLLVAVTAMALHGQTTATIAGQVRDQRLRPIYGARVHAYSVPDGSPSTSPFHTSVLSGKDGTFQAATPAGTFRICAELPNSLLLPTCIWEKPLQVKAVANQVTQVSAITLRRGYPLTVQFQDPTALLPAPALGRAAQGQVVVGIKAPNGMFVPMPVRLQSASVREHALVVAPDTQVMASICTKGVALADASGNKIDASKGYQFSAKIAGGKTPTKFTFQVGAGGK
jgi:hypothetical protein